jgi:hypothetical protein
MYVDIYVRLRDCNCLLYVCESFLQHVYDLLLNLIVERPLATV